MVPRVAYAENLALIAFWLKKSDLPTGAVVECGTWRGGMAAGMMEVAGGDRQFYFFDSFEGLPPAGPLDGDRAHQADMPHDNCRASLEEFQGTIARTGVDRERIHVYPGFFDRTLRGFEAPPLAVLRLDADWYESTMICLETFWDHMLPGGLVLLDDYHAWEGCSKAVHAFLATRIAAEQLRSSPLGTVTYIVKK